MRWLGLGRGPRMLCIYGVLHPRIQLERDLSVYGARYSNDAINNLDCPQKRNMLIVALSSAPTPQY